MGNPRATHRTYQRHVVWFSAGVASTVMAEIVRHEHSRAILVRCVLGGEHPDNNRYVREVERRLKVRVKLLRSAKYIDHWDVIRRTRWVNGPDGARCTGELKKRLRFDFQRTGDIQYFGYTVEAKEQERATRFADNFPEVKAEFPLINRGLTKQDCVGIVAKWGIAVPEMYRLGYYNNNCIGCVKGGMGYWNKVRVDFPEVFERMLKLEREIGASCIKNLYLDELDPNAGRHQDFEIQCDFNCQSYELSKTP